MRKFKLVYNEELIGSYQFSTDAAVKSLNNLSEAFRNVSKSQNLFTDAVKRFNTAVARSFIPAKNIKNLKSYTQEVITLSQALSLLKGTRLPTIKIADHEDSIAKLKELRRVLSGLATSAERVSPSAITMNKSIRDTTQVLNKQTQAVHISSAGWKYWARLFVVQVLHLGIYRFIYAVQNSIKILNELDVKISEIRSIGQKNTLNFDAWYSEIARLSSTYGATLEDVTEGIYQTISNQIAEGAGAVKFMESALKFARVTVSSTADSVNLLSSAINAYGLSAEDADEVAASLFKTIELGRVRASEIADTLGNTAATAGVLGVSLDDLNAALAVLTIQGKKPDVALTQLRNIMLKLSKPTEDLMELFKSWGVDSGEAAIRAYGFAGVLEKLNDDVIKVGESGRSSTSRIAELFKDIRPISGVISLIGNNMDMYNQSLAKYSNSMSDYMKAAEVTMESTGKKMLIELQQVKAYIITEITPVFRDAFFVLTRSLGGLKGTLETVIKLLPAITLGSLEFVKLFRAAKVAEAAIAANVSKIQLLGGKVTVLNRALMSTATTLRLIGTATLKVTAILVAIEVITKEFKRYIEIETQYYKLLRQDTETRINLLDEYIAKLNTLAKTESEILNKRKQAAFAYIASLKSQLGSISTKLADDLEKSTSRINDFMSNLKDILKNRIREIEKIFETLKEAFKESMTVTLDFSTGKKTINFYKSIIESISKEQSNKANLKILKSLKDTSTLPRFEKAYYREVGVRLDKDSINQVYKEFKTFEKKFEIFKKLYDIETNAVKKLYSNNEVVAARELVDKLLADTEELYNYGVDINKVYNTRLSLLNLQAKYEKDYRDNLKVQAIEAQKLLILDKERLAAVEVLEKELKDVLNQKDISTEVKLQKSEIILKRLDEESAGVSDPKIIQAIEALKANSIKLVGTEKMTSAIESLKTDNIASVNDFRVDVLKALQTINASLQARALELELDELTGKLEKQYDKLKDASEELRKYNVDDINRRKTIAESFENARQVILDNVKFYMKSISIEKGLHIPQLEEFDKTVNNFISKLTDPKIAITREDVKDMFNFTAYSNEDVPIEVAKAIASLQELIIQYHALLGKGDRDKLQVKESMTQIQVLETEKNLMKEMRDSIKQAFKDIEIKGAPAKGEQEFVTTDYERGIDNKIKLAVDRLDKIHQRLSDIDDRAKEQIALEEQRRREIENLLNSNARKERPDWFGTRGQFDFGSMDDFRSDTRYRFSQMAMYYESKQLVEKQLENMFAKWNRPSGVGIPDVWNLNRSVRPRNFFEQTSGSGYPLQSAPSTQVINIKIGGEDVANIMIDPMQRAFNRGQLSVSNNRVRRIR